ncbi:ketopantoate reductase family protein [Halorubellus sp. JP-L1]|uniref:ketopantoate reductase family protein n=1 Tax=Halorubellus sp. JP-L1 TaxID=2715753 RepID=UPI00140891E7|nr:ketopantoate reductase family protein [Halorubellus sp. JP-L1]NHN43622.1 ketopantoate reductase family protein [Halorubellus sp. JP-L1]
MEVVVFGAGSLGSLVGGVLAREHDVTLVGRDPHVAAVRESGLRVEGAFEVSTTPGATTDGTGLSGDVALVTVKAFDTGEAAAALATGEFDAVCSLQNGMGNEDELAARLDCEVLAGTATCGAILRSPGVVECTGRGEVVVGAADGGKSAHADALAAALAGVGFDADAVADVPRRLWAKLAVNAGINAVTALARADNGAVLSGDANDLARAAARETARVARARDVRLSNREAVERVEAVAAGTATNASSMRQDVEAGRRTEVDAINGYVVDAAADARRELDLEVPVNRTLAALLRAWEREHDVRSD